MTSQFFRNKPTSGCSKYIGTLICILCIAFTTYGQNKIKALPDDPLATNTDKQFIGRSYEIARNAVAHGNYPFGALLVHEGKIVAEYENEVSTTRDVTKHAETGLISYASKKLSPEILSKCTLYTSTEPCLMCCGAVYWAGITKIVFGTSEEQMNMLMTSETKNPHISSKELFQKIKPGTIVIGPVLEEEGLSIHASFWSEFKKRPAE